jgi:hypothetical protein
MSITVFSNVSKVLTASIIIALMMEAVNTSETSINFYQTTWCNIPEDSHLHTHCCENLKYQQKCEIYLHIRK